MHSHTMYMMFLKLALLFSVPHPLSSTLQAKEIYIPGVFLTERAGDALAAALLNSYDQEEKGGDGENTGPAAEVGVTVSFEPDNSVGRAWAVLGATRWPAGLLEARVLARQLQVNCGNRVGLSRSMTFA